jgi:hypothetical protein
VHNHECLCVWQPQADSGDTEHVEQSAESTSSIQGMESAEVCTSGRNVPSETDIMDMVSFCFAHTVRDQLHPWLQKKLVHNHECLCVWQPQADSGDTEHVEQSAESTFWDPTEPWRAQLVHVSMFVHTCIDLAVCMHALISSIVTVFHSDLLNGRDAQVREAILGGSFGYNLSQAAVEQKDDLIRACDTLKELHRVVWTVPCSTGYQPVVMTTDIQTVMKHEGRCSMHIIDAFLWSVQKLLPCGMPGRTCILQSGSPLGHFNYDYCTHQDMSNGCLQDQLGFVYGHVDTVIMPIRETRKEHENHVVLGVFRGDEQSAVFLIWEPEAGHETNESVKSYARDVTNAIAGQSHNIGEFYMYGTQTERLTSGVHVCHAGMFVWRTGRLPEKHECLRNENVHAWKEFMIGLICEAVGSQKMRCVLDSIASSVPEPDPITPSKRLASRKRTASAAGSPTCQKRAASARDMSCLGEGGTDHSMLHALAHAYIHIYIFVDIHVCASDMYTYA